MKRRRQASALYHAEDEGLTGVKSWVLYIYMLGPFHTLGYART